MYRYIGLVLCVAGFAYGRPNLALQASSYAYAYIPEATIIAHPESFKALELPLDMPYMNHVDPNLPAERPVVIGELPKISAPLIIEPTPIEVKSEPISEPIEPAEEAETPEPAEKPELPEPEDKPEPEEKPEPIEDFKPEEKPKPEMIKPNEKVMIAFRQLDSSTFQNYFPWWSQIQTIPTTIQNNLQTFTTNLQTLQNRLPTLQTIQSYIPSFSTGARVYYIRPTAEAIAPAPVVVYK